MSQSSEQLQLLTHLFDALAQHQDQSASLEQRTEVLCRMKILLDKIDGVVFAREPDKDAKISSGLD
jgi:hypothetical protein